jgi:hypothetical protein
VLLGEDPRSNACQFEKCSPRLDYERFVRFVLDFGTSRGSAWRRAHHLAPTRALSAAFSALKMWRFFGVMDVFGLTGKTRCSESMEVACVWVGLTTDREWDAACGAYRLVRVGVAGWASARFDAGIAGKTSFMGQCQH